MIVRPPHARDGAGTGAVVGFAGAWARERMPEEKHGTPGGCQALRRSKANDFNWMQLKPMMGQRRWRRRNTASIAPRAAAATPHRGAHADLRDAASARAVGMRARSTPRSFVRESPPLAP